MKLNKDYRIVQKEGRRIEGKRIDKQTYRKEHDSAIIIFVCLMLALLLLLLASTAEAQLLPAVDTTKAVIHHTATDDVSIETIRNYHVNVRGWDDVGYHFIIRSDGTVEKGRSLSKKGAHAKGRNQYIGIALTGHDTFSDMQKESLKQLLNRLGVREIFPHHEQCPGKGINLNQIVLRGVN